jgi:hypothetical protein
MKEAKKKSGALSKIAIVGQGMDELEQRYLKLQVAGSDVDLPPYSTKDLLDPKNRLFPELGDAGCRLLSHGSQASLLKILEDYDHDAAADFIAVPRLGSFGNFYVRPRSIVGKLSKPVERALGNLDPLMLQKYRWRGTLRRWHKEIGSLCIGNPVLMFTASLACTGPILSFVDGPRTGGFQITGPAESGKTAAAMVAGSIWGCHRDSARAEKGFSENWNTTINAMEQTAQAHCDALYIADETTQAGTTAQQRAQTVTTAIFLLSEGGKKMRYNEPAGAGWRFYFLSTSNLTLDELAVAGNVAIDDQHRGRLTDILLPRGPGTHGIYQNLRGFPDGATLTDTIKDRCRRTFGTPGYELVRRIYKNPRTISEVKLFVAARRKAYIQRARHLAGEKGVRPLERVIARFATVYAAGSLAIHLGIFRWPRSDLLRAVLACQFDCSTSEKPFAPPPSALPSRLAEYFTHNQGRFWDLDQNKPYRKRHVLGSVPGYSHTFKGKAWFYLTSHQLKAIIGTGHAATKLKRQLVADGLMAATGQRDLVQRPVFQGKGNKGYRWVHAFRDPLVFSRMEGP